MSPTRPLFLYDSDCGICTSLKNIASFLDASHRVDFVTIDEAEEKGYLDSIPPSLRFTSSRFLSPDGSISSGGDAILDMFWVIPSMRYLSASISRIPYGTQAIRRAYGFFSKMHDTSCGIDSYVSHRIPVISPRSSAL